MFSALLRADKNVCRRHFIMSRRKAQDFLRIAGEYAIMSIDIIAARSGSGVAINSMRRSACRNVERHYSGPER